MDQLNQPEEFNSDAFFNDNSIQQIQQIDADATAALDGVAAVSIPTNPAVTEQVVRQWYSGCLERIAFSRHGHVASISDDGSTVYVECLRFTQDDKTWGLHDRHALNTIFEDAISLEFSQSGGELAVVDIKGRISIFHLSPVALNRLIQARQGILDPVDDVSQPIGMFWLHADRQGRAKHVALRAVKSEDRWNHENAQAKPLGPYWHRGLVVAHRNGTVTLCYQRGDGQYAKVTRGVSEVPDSTLYSHAAFAPTAEGKLLAVLHSFDAVLSVVLLSIDWTEVRSNVEGVPVITIETVSNHVSSQSSGSALLGELYDPNSWSLSHLKVLPTSEVEQSIKQPPTILSVSTGVNKSVSSTDPGYLVSSLLRRWTVAAAEPKLHARFDELSAKAPNTFDNKSTLYSILPLPEKEESAITSIHLTEGTPIVAITTYDNRTDFLNQDDLSSASFAISQTEVTSLAQSGFTLPFTQPALFPAFSPNAAIRADLMPGGKINLIHMTYPFPEDQQNQDSSLSAAAVALDPGVDAALASLTLSFARACWTNTAFDDLLLTAAAIPSHLDTAVLRSLYTSMFRPTEFVHEKTSGSDLERVFHKQVVGKALNWHALLIARNPRLPYMGISRGDNTVDGGACRGWTLPAQWAYLSNCIRFTATLLYMSLREVQNANAPHSDAFIELLTGNIRWGLGVIRFILQGVLEVGDRESHPEFFVEGDGARLGDDKGDGSQGLIALLLNCHWSRVFLIAIVRAIRAYAKINEPRGRGQMAVLGCIQRETMGKGLTFQSLEALFEYRWSAAGDVDGDIAETGRKQVRMMTEGKVEAGYEKTVGVLLAKLIDVKAGLREREMIDRLKLFTERIGVEEVFMNGCVLGGSAKGTGEENGQVARYDIHKKTLITKGQVEGGGTEAVVRRCVRCGSYSEDVKIPGKEWPRPIAQIMGKCVCDGSWVLEKWDSE